STSAIEPGGQHCRIAGLCRRRGVEVEIIVSGRHSERREADLFYVLESNSLERRRTAGDGDHIPLYLGGVAQRIEVYNIARAIGGAPRSVGLAEGRTAAVDQDRRVTRR